MTNDIENSYHALTNGAGFVELHQRSCIQLTGDDRKSFFHNFCTNDIKSLDNGDCCEAFVLNEKGKTLGFVHVLSFDDSLILTGHGDQATTLLEHLDKYLIREDAELTNASDQTGSLFVAGPQAAEKIEALTKTIPDVNNCQQCTIGDANVDLAHIELAGFGLLILAPLDQLNRVKTTLKDAGVDECSDKALEIVRVENRTPWFGIDVDSRNLPQELQRDEKAISFEKGCYLGQETVARIDARGRVNQLLVGLTFDNETPIAPGDELIVDDKVAGRITSIVDSPRHQSKIGLGYVRRAYKDPGTKLGPAKVLEDLEIRGT